jgi:hypothetical protein
MKSLEHKPQSINEYQLYVNSLYGEVNDARSIEYIYAYLFRNGAYLSRVIGEKGDSKKNFIKTFSWLFALSSRLKVNLEDSFLRKYPDICPYCLVKPCICIKTGKKPVEYIPEWKAAEEINVKYNISKSANPKLSLDVAVEKINDLYPGNKHIWNAAGPTFQFYRILEELGEVHEAYTSYVTGRRKLENVAEELADVFAWLVSTWGICYPNLKLTDEFINYYYEGCPVCTSEKCKCPNHGDRGERLVEIEQLAKFREKIEELISIAPQYKASLDTLVASIINVSETKSNTGAIRTVNQAKDVLESISDGVDSADKSAKGITSIIASAIGIAEKFGWM